MFFGIIAVKTTKYPPLTPFKPIVAKPAWTVYSETPGFETYIRDTSHAIFSDRAPRSRSYHMTNQPCEASLHKPRRLPQRLLLSPYLTTTHFGGPYHRMVPS